MPIQVIGLRPFLMRASIELRPEPLRVLVVCTANRCRSPVAEVLLWRALVLRGVPAIVRSAGFLEAGQPVDPTMLAVTAERGIDLSAHRSSQLSPELLTQFDLILTMERRHARELVLMGGAQLPVFTMLGLASVRRETDRSGLAAIAHLTAARPDDAFVGRRKADEIADPIGRPATAHHATIDQIDEACAGVVATLWGPRVA